MFVAGCGSFSGLEFGRILSKLSVAFMRLVLTLLRFGNFFLEVPVAFKLYDAVPVL